MSLQTEVFTPGVFETTGWVTIGGAEIPYRTVCQDNLMVDEAGKTVGSMFTYTYLRSDLDDTENRPVMFFFNGGPGSASLWLHVGLFGPLRLRFHNPEAVNTPHIPPYLVRPNELCMLDVCDLVFIDPVGTGWGRLLEKEAAGRFYGLDEDAESFRVLIHTWLSRHHRWNSPKFLLGESYGTIRAGLLSDRLTGWADELGAVGLNGIVLLGNAMGNVDSMLKYDAEPALLALPSMAAANWYHNGFPGTLRAFVDECYAFCEGDYLLALFQGTALSDETRDEIAGRVAYFSGLSKAEVLKQDLRPDMKRSWQQLLENRGLEIGRLDGRFTLPFGTRTGEEGVALGQYTPAFMAAMCGVVKDSLGITHEREYYAITRRDGHEWSFKPKHPPHECLSASMRRNPALRVMFATGCYDMACTIGQARYLATHGGYPRERVQINEYASGHMVYLGEETAREFAEDVRAFVLA